MNTKSSTVVYVINQARAHHLLMSLTSWRRYANYPTVVIDFGLQAKTRELLLDHFANLTFLQPEMPSYLREFTASEQAFVFKSLLAQWVASESLLFLDSDILVVNPAFFSVVQSTPRQAVGACVSAWDHDFHWTYTSQSLPLLQDIVRTPAFALSFDVPNSGVWFAAADVAKQVSVTWSNQLLDALGSRALRNSVRPGTSIGDQEFLGTACNLLSTPWHHLPGSVNMQVHDSKMAWDLTPDGVLQGGHFGEPLEAVKAIHYGCSTDFNVEITPDQIKTPCIRERVLGAYREVLDQCSNLPGV